MKVIEGNNQREEEDLIAYTAPNAHGYWRSGGLRMFRVLNPTAAHFTRAIQGLSSLCRHHQTTTPCRCLPFNVLRPGTALDTHVRMVIAPRPTRHVRGHQQRGKVPGVVVLL